MADKKEREYVNPKYLLRKMLESLPAELPEELTCTVLNLYAHSNGFLEKADVDAGVFTFTVTASFSQLAKVCHLTPKGMKKRLIRLRDDCTLRLGKAKLSPTEATTTAYSGLLEYPGYRRGGVLETLRVGY